MMRSLSGLKKTKYWFIYILLLAFLLIKMFRGVYGDYTSKGGVWNYIQILFILVGVVFLFSKYGSHNKVINIFLFFTFWIMLVSFLNIGNQPIDSLVTWFFYFMCLCAPMIMLTFYCLGLENDILDLSVLIKVTYYVLIVMFYFSMTSYRVTSDFDEFIAFSDIYYPMCLLPLVLLQTKPQRSFIPLLAIMLGIIVSGKRGGLIMVAIVAMIYYFFGQKRKVGTQIITLAMFAGIIVASFYLVNYMDSSYGINSLDRMMNAVDDGGSGRVWRWEKIMTEIGNSSVWCIISGHGFDAIYKLVGGRAHNDFIEVFYNYGFFAVLLYVGFYIRLISTNIRQFKMKYPNAKYLTCSIVVALGLALVSYYVVEPTYLLSSVFVIGLQLGDWTKFARNNYKIIK